MTLDKMILFIMGIGVLLGAIDLILGNKWGLGSKFEEGFMCLGPTALSMVGMMCIAPLIANLLSPLIVPFYHFIGADPAMFASILAIDMGGYPLAIALADSPLVGQFSGLIVSSMLGVTMIFTIPLGLTMLKSNEHPYFAKGLLIGLIPIPIGSFIGGFLMKLPFKLLCLNSLPTLLIAILLMIGLVLNQQLMVKGFIVFGKGVKILTTIGLAAAAFKYLTNFTLIPDMPDILECMSTVSSICIVLLGSLPLMTLLLRLFQKPFEALGRLLSLNSASIGGILFSCISVLPVLKIYSDMNERGKIVCTAFFVSSIATFAAHLGFVVDVAPQYLLPMMVAKLSSAFIGALLALVLTHHLKNNCS